MAHVVTGPLAVIRDDAGKLRYYYQGTQLPADLPEGEVARLVDRGLVVETPEDLEEYEDLDSETPDGEDDAAEGSAPPKAAAKDAWVDYAVASGADRAEAEGLTKVELIERYGA